MTNEIWTELQIETTDAAAELLAAELGELTGGVELRDAGTLLRAPTGRTIVVVLTEPGEVEQALAAAEATLAIARDAGTIVDPVIVRRREAHEDEWRDVWKQFFRATRIGRRFIVRPSWDPGQIADSDEVIDLDPGRAFGTGAHPSTRLAIALAEHVRDAQASLARFLDLGCGSGILAIAAARLWPGAAGLAVDNDPEATGCTDENLARNGVTSVRTVTGTLDAIAGEPPFDLVLANIQKDVLEAIAPALPTYVRREGAVVLSGLLVEQADDVVAAYAARGFALERRLDEGEWAALLMRRTG